MKDRFELFTILIHRIGRNIRKIENREVAQYGLRSVHVSCLYYLYLSHGLTLTELCERCEEDKATVSRAVGYLEKNGYLHSDEKKEKRYKYSLLLTEKGKQVGGEILAKINAVLGEMNDGLTEEEREAFYRSLAVISEGLDRVAKQETNGKDEEEV